MSTSSAHDTSSITLDDILNDTITITSSPTVTWDSSASYTIATSAMPTTSYSLSSGGMISNFSSSHINTISSIDTSHSFTINLPEEWVNCLPDFYRIEKMCKEYPGLAIAFEKFKTVYKLVKDDYDTPKDKRHKP